MKNNCQELLLSSLNNFYDKNHRFKILFKNIIHGNHKLSLRLIDWLITHYSKNKNIYYWIDINDDNNIYYKLPIIDNIYIKKINIYNDYRAQLKSYSKLNFDTFRRHERISFYIHNDEFIETTVGQLNFFRWVFNNNIINYVLENYDIIYNNMINNNKNCIKKNIFQEIIKTNSVLRFD